MKTLIYRSNIRYLTCFILLLFLGFSSACSDDDEEEDMTMVAYTGSFVKAKDTVTTSATGTVSATFNTETLQLSYTVTWSGLGSEVTNMHFHDAGPVAAGITGFPTTTSGSVSGAVTLTAEQALDLAAGQIYVQIHTSNYLGGEIIATLTVD